MPARTDSVWPLNPRTVIVVLTILLWPLMLIGPATAGASSDTTDTPPFENKTARLTYLKGEAGVWCPQTSQWCVLKVDAVLKPGDKIRVQSGSCAEITTFDRDVIRLAEYSQLQINYLQTDPGGRIRKKGLSLQIGRMWNNIQSPSHAESEYTVWTPNTISRIRGTTFNIDVSPGKTTRIKTYSGSVKIWRFPHPSQAGPDDHPFRIKGPEPVTMQQWTQIILKLHEELTIDRQGIKKEPFNPHDDESHDNWIKWNRMRDRKR